MKKVTVLLILIIITFIHADQPNQLVQFDDNWGKQGFTLTSSSKSNVQINYSIETLQFEAIDIAGEKFTSVMHPRQMLPAEEGTPNLAGESYFIAIPQGADVNVSMLDHRMTIYNDLNIPPAPRIPWDTDNKPLQYSKDISIYNRNAFYPEKIITVSDPTKIRGVDVVIIGIKPFQYNPVTKQLRVYTDISLQVQFIRGNDIFGEERLRSIWYEPILKSAILNYDILPEFDLKKTSTSRIAGYEYIIFCPDDPVFLAWADSIAVFRNEQGIITGVVTTDEIGGNNTAAIENYLNDAYNTWHSPPVAFLLLGDYGTSGNTIVSPIFEEYCVSDHIYADVTENQIEDIIPARITARDEAELATMISKMLDLERNPPTDANFYNNPITALGWETERWFQVCAETVGGFWHNELGKDQIRINEIFEGDPSVDPWSTAPNSTTVLNYFGSSGLGYIPQTPAEMGGWSGGNAAMINNAINSGAFMLLHRDHGGIIGWAEPTYLLGDLDYLNNENPVFVYSMNCKTGMYNNPEECFAEKFHRHQYGALGLVAASEMSMSFVNDTYLWGMIDHLWPDFMPDLGTFPTDCDFKRTAFASTAGKLFLYYSDWPFNIDHKEVTFNLFHHHGGAFLNLYSEVPQQLTVSHSLQYLNGSPTFEVTADEGSFIGISAGEEVVATALGTGSVVSIDIPQQLPYTTMKVTVTKQNYYRYSEDVAVITQGPYLIFDEVAYTEIAGHIDDSLQPLDIIEMDVTIRNIGLTSSGDDVTAILSSTSNQVNIIDDQLSCGVIAATGILTVEDAFQVEFLAGIEDETDISFELEVTSSGVTWTSEFELELLASELQYDLYSVEMTSGVENILDPGETGEIMVSIQNIGNGFSYDTNILLNTNDPYVTLTGSGFIPVIDPGETEISVQPVTASVSPDCPLEYVALIELTASDENGLIHENSFNLPIGFIANYFEIGDIGWEHVALGNDWLDEWHLSNYRNYTIGGQYSMKCGGLDENHYSNFVYAALIMPEIVLGSNSTITFHHWMNVGDNNYGLTWDGGLVEISLNGGDWEQITPVGGYPCSMVNMQTSPFAAGTEVFAGEINWEEVELDLSSYSGIAQIRFVMGTCGLVTNEGWYIDDVIYTNLTGADNNFVLPFVTSLKSNFPNPFNPTTTISFSTTESTENTKISIYNLKGQKVKTLVNEKLSDGEHSLVWNGTDDSGKSVSSGIYFYKMKSGNFEHTKKMILMK